MKILLLVLQRKESYPGQHAPEVVDAIDEYVLDDYPEGWIERVRHHKALVQDDAEAWAVIEAHVDVKDLLAALRPEPNVVQITVTP